ncbi:Type I secretion outer membrane protein, TolC family [Paraburkholderia ribeironis]|uniref:Type I secretion outer membrane protein, TolC family n=1 Tax=Paraburkholderia ribeironis TaxID=1247936 RepID=A0A1N7SMK6_9BURK|nr:TolC family outer membrane protein [Paraburkholderia ribeironis]SIT48638.1 Type I secretion outer membrane protein, TolC family [Paraburkholderia ribeironis]
MLLGALLLVVWAFRAEAASLDELVNDAIAHDATLASAEAAYRAGLEKEPEARAALLPHLGLTQSDFKTGIHVPGQPAAAYSTVGESLSLNQTVFKWDDWQSWQQSKLSVADAGLALASARQDLLLRVAQAYLDALAAHDGFLLAQEHQRSVNEQLALTARSFALGAATVVDLDEAQAAADAAQADLIQAQGVLDRRYAALQKIVGHPVDGVDPLDAKAGLPAVAQDASDRWVAEAQTSGFEVKRQEIALEISRREVSKTDAGYMPSVSIIGSVSHGNAAFINGQTNFYTGANRATSGEIGIQISIPLFDGLSTVSRKRETLALRDKVEDDLEGSRRSAALDARQSFLGVQDGLAQVVALRTAQRSAETALKSNQKGFRVGVRINADVLGAEDKLFGTRRDLAKARYDTLMQFLHLKASIAQLDQTTLSQLVAGGGASSAEPGK